MSITWRVEFDKSAEKELKKLERQTIERIFKLEFIQNISLIHKICE